MMWFLSLIKVIITALKEADISQKKTQKKNPAKNNQLVQAKRKGRVEFLAKWQPEIEAEKLTVLMIGNIYQVMLGEKQIKKEKLRLNMQKKDRLILELVTIKPKNLLCKNQRSGNTKHTIEFIKYLQQKRPGNTLAIFWDGATYHNSL